LAAQESPFNKERNCTSVSNKEGFKIPLIKGVNQLTNLEEGSYGSFSITELEVWQVKHD